MLQVGISQIKKIHNRTTQRLLHLDFLRGIFLCVIIVDHLQKFPGLLDLFTGRGYLWASAAEGFFFISGMMIGLIRGRREAKQPFVGIWRKLWQRAGSLYITNVILTLLYTAIALAFINHAGAKPGVMIDASWWHIIWRSLTLQYTYGWADFLQYYAVYLFFSPLVVWLLRRGLWLVVLAGSVLVWYFGKSDFYLSWQLLFFVGAVGGYYLQEIHTWFQRLQPGSRRWLIGGTFIATAVTYIASNIFILGSSFLRNRPGVAMRSIVSLSTLEGFNSLTGTSFDKVALGVGRLTVFAIWFGFAYYLARRLQPHYERRPFGRALILFGQNSLYVYIVHSALLFVAGYFLQPSYNFVLNTLIETCIIGLVYLCVRKRFLFAIIPR